LNGDLDAKLALCIPGLMSSEQYMSALFVYKQGFEGKYNQSLLSTWQSLE
jgi:hypothetical protein